MLFILLKKIISFYYNTETIYGEQSGDNSFVIERITSDWDESTVTWNTQPTSTSVNQIRFDGSSSVTQDFPHLDITTLVQDMCSDMDNSYGLAFKLENESVYRRLIFASSDNVDENIRPKLEIYYRTNK